MPVMDRTPPPHIHPSITACQDAWSMPHSLGGAALSAAATRALQAIVGLSPAMVDLRQRIPRLAATAAPVLITGESGCGKELVARALHACSSRAKGPWVAINCAAIPEALMEAEFFGVRKGAYTGALCDRPGLLQSARGGTLFLDEVGELSLPLQAKLLRALQEQRVRPLGATQEEVVDVRILSATHRDLTLEVQRGRFRQDLLYRLHVLGLHVPPLRARREDIIPIAQALLAQLGQARPPWWPVLLQHLYQAPLAGNVRELENMVQRALALGQVEEVPLPQSPPAPVPAVLSLPPHLPTWLDHQERAVLIQALERTGFNRTAAAHLLGLSLRQMRYRMERLDIAKVQPSPLQSSDNAPHDVQH